MLPRPALMFLSFTLVFLGCITTTDYGSKSTRPRIKKSFHAPPTEPELIFYEKHSDWESPFNPHDVLRNWTKLSFETEKNIYFVTVGNPKHGWSDWSVLEDPLERNIPSGEVASAVTFVFRVGKRKKIYLEAFEFVDNLGVRNLFGWDKGTKCYVRFPDTIQQRLI